MQNIIYGVKHFFDLVNNVIINIIIIEHILCRYNHYISQANPASVKTSVAFGLGTSVLFLSGFMNLSVGFM